MGESLLLLRNDSDAMEVPDSTRFALETSVSFGRFENDKLSWEKWSSFSPNRYLEEVEKCATPGSVASKKAFFESRYKSFPPKKHPHVVDEHDATKSDRSDAVYPSEQSPVLPSESKFIGDASEGEEPIVEEVVMPGEEATIESKETDEGNHETLLVDLGVRELAQSKVKVQDRRKSISAAKKTLAKEKTKVRPKQEDRMAFQTFSPKQRTPQVSKKDNTSVESNPRCSSRKTNSSSIGRKKSAAATVVPQSIPLGSQTENKKPLLMETMKDKEIVKRAFKLFQKSFSEARNSSTTKPILDHSKNRGIEGHKRDLRS